MDTENCGVAIKNMKDKKSNEMFLRSWLSKTLVDNPDLIIKGETPIGIYAELQTIFLREIQEAFKFIIKEYGKQ
jgi:hypothetical protein